MNDKKTLESKNTGLANAIRSKTGNDSVISMARMPEAINGIRPSSKNSNTGEIVIEEKGSGNVDKYFTFETPMNASNICMFILARIPEYEDRLSEMGVVIKNGEEYRVGAERNVMIGLSNISITSTGLSLRVNYKIPSNMNYNPTIWYYAANVPAE